MRLWDIQVLPAITLFEMGRLTFVLKVYDAMSPAYWCRKGEIEWLCPAFFFSKFFLRWPHNILNKSVRLLLCVCLYCPCCVPCAPSPLPVVITSARALDEQKSVTLTPQANHATKRNQFKRVRYFIFLFVKSL